METKYKKLKKILFCGIVSIILVIIIVIKLWSWHLHELTWEEFSAVRDLDSLIYASPSEMNENDIVFVIDKELPYSISHQSYIPDYFVIQRESVGRRRLWRSTDSTASREYDWESLNLHIYDIFTKEHVRTIDLLSLLDYLDEDIIAEFGYTRLTSSYQVDARENGELYLGVILSERRNDSWTDRRYKWLRMNFHTGEITLEESFAFERQRWTREENLDFLLQMSVFEHDWNIGDYDILSINGIEMETRRDLIMGVSSFPGSARITLQAKLLPEESQSLYSRFPGLRQFQGREDLEVNVVITGYPTAEEILEMFMEDGREISFEGLRLRYDWSIDGEEHDINSFEDYFRLSDTSRWDED